VLPAPSGDMVRGLWIEEVVTIGARFVRALDHPQAQARHNLADLATWEFVEQGLAYMEMDAQCVHDAFLRALCAGIRALSGAKMRAGGIDLDAVRRLAGRT
jgi:hypothetical protein